MDIEHAVREFDALEIITPKVSIYFMCIYCIAIKHRENLFLIHNELWSLSSDL